MKKIVGLDFGLKRIGIAVASSFFSFALPLGKIIRVQDDLQNIKNILSLVKEEKHIACFVLGLPLHLSTEESVMSTAVRKFADVLEKQTAYPVHLIDERLTSKAAKVLLFESGLTKKKGKKHVDALSATLILQTYIDCEKNKKKVWHQTNA